MKKVAIGFVLILIALQFIPVDKTNPPVTADLDAPPDIKSVLKRSCYDCHSNETKWPWYSSVAPVSWLVASDVEEGRSHLNFSEWGNLTRQKIARKKEHIWEEVSEGGMPLSKYIFIHTDAKLSKKDKDLIHDWTGGSDEEDKPNDDY